LIAAILLPNCTLAQTSQVKKADKLYENFAYSRAVVVYEKLYLADSTNARYIQRLAYSYNRMLSYTKATYFYSRLVRQSQHQPIDIYEYAQLLRIGNKIEDYKVWLEKYLIESPGDQRARKQLDNIDLLSRLSSNLKYITIKNMDGNTRFTDMCPTFYKDMIVYSSAKDSLSSVKNNYEWNNQPFLDLYLTKPNQKQSLQTDEPFSSKINSMFHEGPVCFTSDYKRIYFTRNSYLNKKISLTPEGVNNLKIFISDFNGKEWGKITAFQYNSNKYSVGHPALSPDNKTLYFVSDMPGGFGETDIYKSEWTNGSWGKPINLGESINTKGKEMFPYMDKDSILYFASDGQPGIGGLDIFAAREEEAGKYMVVNMGTPINSQYDDFGFVIDKDSLSGYFSSNRLGGKGEDDNYSFSVNNIDLSVVNYDDYTKKVMPGSKISLLSNDGIVLETKIADDNGAAIFAAKPMAKYQLLAENTTYLSGKKNIQIRRSLISFRQHEELFLKRNIPSLTITVIDKETGLIIPSAVVNISEGKKASTELKDNKGVFRMMIRDSTSFSVYATAINYFGKTSKYLCAGNNSGEYVMTIELEKMTAGKQFVLEDLYYNLDKSNIRPDAAIVLDKLVKILIDNPSVRIEIGSHTDSRASTEYNQKLSQRRSSSVLAYLFSKGITRNRLEAKGYGESQLTNRCADGVDCTEAEHQANRRTVITILKNGDFK
jgi:outer membrane protein OmpA-like peptidoglycan-associated protein